MASVIEQLNQHIRGSVFFKMMIVGILILILLIPSGMIHEIVNERQFREQNVISEVSSKWGNSQTITGPILAVPYQKQWNDEKGKLQVSTEYAYFLPDTLKIDGKVFPEIRRRGIYEVLLYRSDLALDGEFFSLDFSSMKIPADRVFWKDSQIVLGIPDLRGIRDGIQLEWQGKTQFLEPGTLPKDILVSSVGVPVDITKPGPYSFHVQLKLNGSNSLLITPVGKTTDVKLSGDWTHPSFIGAFLPENSEITSDGFTSQWKILHLNRNFPQQWLGTAHQFKNFPQTSHELYQKEFFQSAPVMDISENSDAESSAFGVQLLIPMDHYQKVERSAKYMILFIFLTFLIFFFVEILNRKKIHPIQYLLVGFALLIFYLLLLSLSEYIGFSYAYFSGSAAIISLIILYSLSVFHHRRLSALLGGILIILYGFLYVLLQLEDYALLMGSIGLFTILAIIMLITRKIDWYSENV